MEDTPNTPHSELRIPHLFDVRRLLPADAAGVAALVRRVYGDGYPRAELYRPAEVARRDAAGEWVAAVAVAGERVVGFAVLEPSGFGPVAEVGGLMVDPEFRDRGVIDRVRELLAGEMPRLGLAGTWADVGAANTAAQAVANRSPAKPVGLALGLWPGSPRPDYLCYFRHYRPPPPVVARVPPRHRDIVVKIYAQFDQPVEFRDDGPVPPGGGLTVARHPAFGHAFVRVGRVGTDTAGQLEAAAAGLDVGAVYLDVPVSDAGAVGAAELAGRLGFSLLGVGPYFCGGRDALRLQRVVQPPDPDRLKVRHRFGRELAGYVLADWKRVRGG